MKKTGYNLTHDHHTTCDIGTIIPIACYDVLPGDIVQHNSEMLVRTTPLLAPIMHPVMITTHSYFVPNNILWNDPGVSSWQDFITGGDDGLDASTHPYYDLNGKTIAATDLVCRLGMAPPATYAASTKKVNVLPLRAYQMIIRENYMDPDLSTEPTIDLTDGDDTTTTTTMSQACYAKDQFTTARGFQHRGNDVTVDLNGTVPVTPDSQGYPTFDGSVSGADRYLNNATSTTTVSVNAAIQGQYSWKTTGLEASLASTGMTFEDFMLAQAHWKFQRRMGRHGADYQDFLKTWGMRRQDHRFQKPEYLGGGSQMVQFSEVLATDNTNTGDMYGHGLGYLGQRRFRRMMPDFGWVITVMFVRPMHTIVNSIHRSFLRETKYDYYVPEMLNIGDQAIKKQEVYSETADWDGVFGYNQRAYEYRDIPNRVSGEMLTIYDHYHCARDFDVEPALNDAFVKIGTGDFDRALASSVNDGFLINARNNVKMLRPVLRLV